jgi:putative colanic acid biosynthesis UDP-glucose lipid carrier transferase
MTTVLHLGRYSKYIRPISTLIDLMILSVLCLFFFRALNVNTISYLLYQAVGWMLVAYFVKFYEVYRFTSLLEIFTKLMKQSVLFLLVVIAFFPFSKETLFSGEAIAVFMVSSMILVTIAKVLLFYYLKKYRISTGSNFRNVVIVGHSNESIKLKQLFESRIDFGYRFLGFFSDKKQGVDIKGNINDLKSFVLLNKIDEIYCSLNEMSNSQFRDLVLFADENNKAIKFIPDSKEIFSKKLKVEYYEFFPVLSLKKTILHEPSTKALKRTFDIVFSLLVIVGLLSWLVPLLAILIKLESHGSVFFKQGRPGLDEEEFFCFKFRSMRVNKTTEKEASRNDPRVTRIGRFIRKTSVDELPQFLNVLLGDMSVVGPRPHLWSQNAAYGDRINKYMMRHYVKPGITGLAQVRGFRGEIETDTDMINRIRLDVFYIENWSLLLDLNIIFQTIVNIFKGEEKAY